MLANLLDRNSEHWPVWLSSDYESGRCGFGFWGKRSGSELESLVAVSGAIRSV